MKRLYNIEINKSNLKNGSTYNVYTYDAKKEVFVPGNGGENYDAKQIQQIIKYKESNDIIEITTVKAEVSFDGGAYRSVNNEKTLVQKDVSIEDFYFTSKNVNLFPQIKYIFKKNSEGKYYLDNIENLNFTEDFIK